MTSTAASAPLDMSERSIIQTRGRGVARISGDCEHRPRLGAS